MLLSTSSQADHAARIASLQPDLHHLTIPTMAELLDPTPVLPEPHGKSWDQARLDPFARIQTLSSSNTPEIVTLKHANLSCIDAFQTLTTNGLLQQFAKQRLLAGFPFYHHSGLLYGLIIPVWFDSTAVLPPSGALTADAIDAVHVHGNVEVSVVPTLLAINLTRTERYLEHLQKLKGVIYEGGCLPESAGKQIIERTHLSAGFGAAEYLTVALAHTMPEEWPYLRFDEDAMGVEFQESRDDLFEMVLVRKPELHALQSVFITFPDTQEYRTKELFTRVPGKPGCWKYVSSMHDDLANKPLPQITIGSNKPAEEDASETDSKPQSAESRRSSQASKKLDVGECWQIQCRYCGTLTYSGGRLARRLRSSFDGLATVAKTHGIDGRRKSKG